MRSAPALNPLFDNTNIGIFSFVKRSSISKSPSKTLSSLHLLKNSASSSKLILITSPPYFDVEKYEGAETSTARYSNYELWRDSFYTQLIRKTYSALRQGGVFCLQVGSQKYPLKDDGIRIAQEVGFTAEVIETNFLKQSALHDTEEEKSEVLLLLQKN